MRTLLVDADVIAFKIASVIEKMCVDDEGYIHYWWADAGEGRDKVDIYLNELVEDMQAELRQNTMLSFKRPYHVTDKHQDSWVF